MRRGGSGDEQAPDSGASGCALNIGHMDWISNYALTIIYAAAGFLAVASFALVALVILCRSDWGDEPWAE